MSKRLLKVGQSKKTFRTIRGMRRKVRVTKTRAKPVRYKVKILSQRLTETRKKKSAWFGHKDKPHKGRKSDRRQIHTKESWERRQRKGKPRSHRITKVSRRKR